MVTRRMLTPGILIAKFKTPAALATKRRNYVPAFGKHLGMGVEVVHIPVRRNRPLPLPPNPAYPEIAVPPAIAAEPRSSSAQSPTATAPVSRVASLDNDDLDIKGLGLSPVPPRQAPLAGESLADMYESTLKLF